MKPTYTYIWLKNTLLRRWQDGIGSAVPSAASMTAEESIASGPAPKRTLAVYRGLMVAVYTVNKTELSLTRSDFVELINVRSLFYSFYSSSFLLSTSPFYSLISLLIRVAIFKRKLFRVNLLWSQFSVFLGHLLVLCSCNLCVLLDLLLFLFRQIDDWLVEWINEWMIVCLIDWFTASAFN